MAQTGRQVVRSCSMLHGTGTAELPCTESLLRCRQWGSGEHGRAVGDGPTPEAYHNEQV